MTKGRLKVVAAAGAAFAVGAVLVVVTMAVVDDEPTETATTELIEPRLRLGEPSGDRFQVEVKAGEEIEGGGAPHDPPSREWLWRLFDSVNRWRVDHNQLPIELNLIATRHADKHSAEMARQQDLHHSSFGLMPGYQAQGETVGRGGDPFVIMRAFMDSPPHKRLILKPEFNNIGVSAVRDANGGFWVTFILGESVF